MSKGNTKPFQRLLQKEKVRLTSEVGRFALRDAVDDNIGYGNHMADDATEAFEQAKGVALRQHMQDLIVEVSDALVRIERGTFGTCESCGAPIDQERLEILPYARMCVECQQKKENS